MLLFDEGLAFSALPSHDAQSIAGLLSTDVQERAKTSGSSGFLCPKPL